MATRLWLTLSTSVGRRPRRGGTAPDPSAALWTSLAAIRHVVLRYGGFYGPGTAIGLAPKAAAAVDHGQPGIYNVVDDEPAPVREWLPVLASALDAKAPRRIPRWLGRLAVGEAATVMMTDVRGASNAKAKRELGLQLRYPSWRLGFTKGLG